MVPRWQWTRVWSAKATILAVRTSNCSRTLAISCICSAPSSSAAAAASAGASSRNVTLSPPLPAPAPVLVRRYRVAASGPPVIRRDKKMEPRKTNVRKQNERVSERKQNPSRERKRTECIDECHLALFQSLHLCFQMNNVSLHFFRRPFFVDLGTVSDPLRTATKTQRREGFHLQETLRDQVACLW